MLSQNVTWEVPGSFGGKTVCIRAYYGANSYRKSSDFTLAPQPLTITFDPDGGELEAASAMTGVDGKLPDGLPVPTREYYRFSYWQYKDLTGHTCIARDDTVYMRPTTLTASWTPVPYTVTVVNGSADRGTACIGETVRITARTYELGVFAMWVVDAGDVSIANPLSPVTNFTMGTEDVTVRALYTHELTLDANGGTVEPTSVRTAPGGGLLDSLPTPVREGYTFLFWTYESNLERKVVTPDTVFKSDNVLRAEWLGILHPVTVQDGTADAAVAGPERTVTITANAREHFTFDHWEVLAGGVTLADANSAVTTFAMGIEPVTVRAYYTYSGETIPEVRLYAAEPEAGATPAAPAVNAGEYRILNWAWYDAETGEQLTAEDTFVRGRSYRLDAYCQITGIGNVFDEQTVGYVNDTQDGVTFTYQTYYQARIQRTFEVADFTVSFEKGSGSGSMAPVEHVGLSYTLPACGFTAPPNYAFGGWDLGQPGDVIAMTDDITLTAQWRQIKGTWGSSKVTWTLDPVTGVLTVSGTGAMKDGTTSAPSPFTGDERIRSVVIGEGITAVGARNFKDCANLTSVTLPGILTKINAQAFSGCANLTDIALLDSLTSVGSQVFNGCTSLREITIPAGVTGISSGAFLGCSGLTDVTVLTCNATVGSGQFVNCTTGALTVHGWEGSTMETWCANNGITFDPWPVTGPCGDEVTWTLDTATGTVTVDGTGPMWDYGLSSNRSPLYGHRYVTSAVVGEGVTHVGSGFFARCARMTSVSLPAALTSIGEEAFSASGLTAVSLPEGATVGQRAFTDCAGLTAVTIPAGWTAVAPGLFDGCTGITSVTLPASLTSIGSAAFRSTAITAVDLPSGLTSIGANAFAECRSLTFVFIPNGVTALADGLFSNCAALSEVVFPDDITSIGMSAFSGCSALTSMVVPRTVTTIGNAAFAYCTGLTEVTLLNPDTVIYPEIFDGHNPALVVYGWSDTPAQIVCGNIGVTYHAWPRSGVCGENVTWTLDLVTGTVTLSGPGPMYNYDNAGSKSPFNGYDRVRSVVVGDGVTSVGNYAFYGCTELTDIDFGSAGSIGMYAFGGCTALTSVDLPQSVSLIGASAFEGCRQLRTAIVRRDSVTMYDAIFYGCSRLTMYGHVNSSAEAFAARYRITFYPMDFEPSFFLPAGLTLVEAGAFQGIPAIAVVFPNPDTAITSGAFDGSGVKYVYAFQGSQAASFAVNSGMFFVPIDADWLASH